MFRNKHILIKLDTNLINPIYDFVYSTDHMGPRVYRQSKASYYPTSAMVFLSHSSEGDWWVRDGASCIFLQYYPHRVRVGSICDPPLLYYRLPPGGMAGESLECIFSPSSAPPSIPPSFECTHRLSTCSRPSPSLRCWSSMHGGFGMSETALVFSRMRRWNTWWSSRDSTPALLLYYLLDLPVQICTYEESVIHVMFILVMDIAGAWCDRWYVPSRAMWCHQRR